MREVNYSLYNLILSTANFDECDTYIDAMRLLYEGVYPHLARLTEENIKMRNMIMDTDKCKDPAFITLSMVEPDVNVLAKRLLERGRDQYLAKKRMNVVDEDGTVKA